MSADHDSRCEAEFIPEAGLWTNCGCADRSALAREAAELGLTDKQTDSLAGQYFALPKSVQSA